MFVVEVGSALTTYSAIIHNSIFAWTITVWLWLTVLFANLAEAVAEGRGKAQAETLRRTKQESVARRLLGWTPGADPGSLREEEVPGTQLRVGDHVVIEAGQVIPGDGDVVEGVASVDESAITGESAPVLRESGGDRSAVTGGTLVLSDSIVVQITSSPGETFLDRMIALVEGATRQKTPNEIALDILISGMTLILLVAVVTLQLMAVYDKAVQSTVVLVTGHRAGHSLVGIAWTALTAAVMFALAVGKTRTGAALSNPVLQTEGRVTLIDGILAAAVLAGLVLNAALGWWQADPAAGYILVFYAAREVRAIITAGQGDAG